MDTRFSRSHHAAACRAINLTILVALLLLGIGISATAQKLVCAGCGKPITTGNWVTAEGKTYHPEHFSCAHCRKAIGRQEYFTKDGKIYDRTCYEELYSLRCDFCGGKLNGTFTKYEGKQYHDSCYTEHIASRCGVCGKVLDGPFVIYEGQKYHESCYQTDVAVKCAYCGGFIEGHYLKDYWGNSYHDAHKGKAKECDFCQRLITPELNVGSRTWKDGRILCGICAPGAITESEAAESLLIVAAVKLRFLGIDVDPSSVRVILVDQAELASITRSDEKTVKGFTDYRESTALFGLVKNRKMNIYLLYGMPRLQMLSAVTHELMHVWQFLNAPLHNDKALCEGSCNYATYLVLREMSNIEAKYLTDKMEDDPDPYYGVGYRKVKAYVEQNGQSAWLSYLKSNTTPPWQ